MHCVRYLGTVLPLPSYDRPLQGAKMLESIFVGSFAFHHDGVSKWEVLRGLKMGRKRTELAHSTFPP